MNNIWTERQKSLAASLLFTALALGISQFVGNRADEPGDLQAARGLCVYGTINAAISSHTDKPMYKQGPAPHSCMHFRTQQ